LVGLLVSAGLALGIVPVGAAPPAASASHRRSPACGRLDAPETALQGDVPADDQTTGRARQGYNCGLALVGATNLGGRGGNANMAWSGHCAYIAGDGIAVVDVSDPTEPRQVRTLHGSGSDDSTEAISAVRTRDRALLVAGRYGIPPTPLPVPVDIYDVSDCARPVLLSTVTFPANVHNVTLSADGKRLFTTRPVQVADLTDPRAPRYLGNIDDELATQTTNHDLSHEAWPSPDGRRLYIGGTVGPLGTRFSVVDISGWPARPVRLISETSGPGHSIRLATIGKRRFVLHSNESVVDQTAKGCVPDRVNPVGGAAQPRLTDITDERRPRAVSTFRLAINEPENCAAQVRSGVNASVHYHDVDDPRRTTFVMLSMWNAGLRIVDVRDPRAPREVAYFNPGLVPDGQDGEVLDQAWAHVRYVASTGHVWLSTATGGFWVLELEPQVRRALGLSARDVRWPRGRPGHPAGSAPPGGGNAVVATDPRRARAYYCTLGWTAPVPRAS
jgi:hypothetical protein